MQLEDLVGIHELSGVDYNADSVIVDLSNRNIYDGQVINFVLDGETYTVMEDDNDGYRSSMREILKTQFSVSNRFPPIQVMCVMRLDGKYGVEYEIADFYDAENGKVVLSVGTDHSDGWYPSFVADFQPANMSLNNPDQSSR